MSARHRPTWLLPTLALTIVLASLPAWTGGFVYDDWLMRDSPAMDGLEDVYLAFVRTSDDYFERPASHAFTGATYRPLAHASLIAVQALGGAPLAHHLVSLGLHLACVGFLYFALLSRTSAGGACALVAVFGLHPLGVEAYEWINGRADVLAGAALAALAMIAMRPLQRRMQGFAAAVAALIAVLAKETALVAVLAVALASMFPRHGWPGFAAQRTSAATFVGAVVGSALALGLRAVLVGLVRLGAVGFDAQQSLGTALARLFAAALSSVLVPLPRTMESLSWKLAQPLGAASIGLLVIGAVALVALLLRGWLRAGVLMLGALVCVAPTVVVSNSGVWYGFDRYLYMPTLLSVLALVETPLSERVERLRSRWMPVAVVAAAGLLAVATFGTARSYRSQSAFFTSMIQLRPDDPSGVLAGAAWLQQAGQREQALRLLDTVPRRGLPRPLASALVTRLARLGARDEAIAVLEDMVQRYPNDPYAIFDLVTTSIQRSDLPRAFAAAERLRGTPGFCDGVQAVLRAAAQRAQIDHARVESFREHYACRQ